MPVCTEGRCSHGFRRTDRSDGEFGDEERAQFRRVRRRAFWAMRIESVRTVHAGRMGAAATVVTIVATGTRCLVARSLGGLRRACGPPPLTFPLPPPHPTLCR